MLMSTHNDFFEKTLITGGSGLLGSHIYNVLKGSKIILDVKPPKFMAEYMIGSITDPDVVKRALQGVQNVIHLAALHGPDLDKGLSDREFIDINVYGTWNILKEAESAGVETFIFASTTAVYGNNLLNNNSCAWIDRSVSPEPKNIYEYSKYLAEQIIERGSLHKVILRFARFRYDRVQDLAINKLSCAVDVRDAASATVLALKKASGITSKPYIVSSRTPFSQVDVLDLGTDASSRIRNYHPNIEKIFLQNGIPLPKRIKKIYDIAATEVDLEFNPIYNYDNFDYSDAFFPGGH